MPTSYQHSIAENLERIHERILAAQRRSGRREEITLVGASKLVPAERIEEAYRAGLRHIGENRVQEFEEKRRRLPLPEAVWHMIGHLQKNKARRAAEEFDRVDSLDNVRLGERLSAGARDRERRLPVLVQVHLGDEPSKHGVEPAGLVELVERVSTLEGLVIEGLMTLPPYLEPAERVRPYFRRLRELAEEIERRGIPGVDMRELSMGMSHDFEVAIEEGATQVRLGMVLFGPRPVKR